MEQVHLLGSSDIEEILVCSPRSSNYGLSPDKKPKRLWFNMYTTCNSWGWRSHRWHWEGFGQNPNPLVMVQPSWKRPHWWYVILHMGYVRQIMRRWFRTWNSCNFFCHPTLEPTGFISWQNGHLKIIWETSPLVLELGAHVCFSHHVDPNDVTLPAFGCAISLRSAIDVPSRMCIVVFYTNKKSTVVYLKTTWWHDFHWCWLCAA